jgi:hypothetical protein
MKYCLHLIFACLVIFQANGKDCPQKLVYGNPEWANKIEVQNGSQSRTFYFEKALLEKRGDLVTLTIPTFIEEGIHQENYISLEMSNFVDAEAPSIEGEYFIRNVNFGTQGIDCMEIERDFGSSGVKYERKIVIKKAIEDFWEIDFDIEPKNRDGLSQVSGILKEVSFREIKESTQNENSFVNFQTSKGELKGSVKYLEDYDRETNTEQGLHAEFEDEAIGSFSIRPFEGKAGVYRLGSMGNRFVVFHSMENGEVAFDFYVFDFEDIKKVQASTFFDFAIGEILINDFEPISKVNVKGPLNHIGEIFNKYDFVGAYHIDARIAEKEGFHYQYSEAASDKDYPNALKFYKQKSIPEINLVHQSGTFIFSEKSEVNSLLSSIKPMEEEEESKGLDCNMIFEETMKKVQEKFGSNEPQSEEEELEFMRYYAEVASEYGLDAGDISELDANEIQDRLMEVAEVNCQKDSRHRMEPVYIQAELKDGYKVTSRPYFVQLRFADMTLKRSSGEMEFIVENEEQGKHNLKTKQFGELPDMAAFLQILGGIQFEMGKAYQLDFQDFKLTQSTSASSGFEGGNRMVRKQNVYPVLAEFVLEATESVKVGDREAYKIQIMHKDFGDGHLLLNFVLSPSPGHGPYRYGGFLYVDKKDGQLLKAENRDGETVFGS